jgi:hypothetical protein
VALVFIGACEYMKNMPEISFTNSEGKTIGRACKGLEGGGTECTNTTPDGHQTVTTYDKEGKPIHFRVIEKPRK